MMAMFFGLYLDRNTCMTIRSLSVLVGVNYAPQPQAYMGTTTGEACA